MHEALAEDGGDGPGGGAPKHTQTKLYCSLRRLQRHYSKIYASDVARLRLQCRVCTKLLVRTQPPAARTPGTPEDTCEDGVSGGEMIKNGWSQEKLAVKTDVSTVTV